MPLYVGATGFMSPFSYDAVRQHVLDHPIARRRVMTGILVSDKTLRGEVPSERYRGRYPAPNLAEAIWRPRSARSEARLWKVVHFNSKQDKYAAELGRIMHLLPSTQAIQLNMYRPSPHELEAFRTVYPNCEIILQFGSRPLSELGDTTNLRRFLGDYNGLVEHVLLDGSGGLGQPLSEARLRPLLESTPWYSLSMCPGVAGGLSAEAVPRLAALLRDFPDLSIDAEGELLSYGALDAVKTIAYLEASRKLFGV